MAFDLLLQRETDADWSMDPSARAEAARRAALPLDFTKTERRTLRLLEPTTASFAVGLVGWARENGIPARLSHVAIYTPEESATHYEGGRSGIKPGRLDWHNVGRAFHVVLPTLPDGDVDRETYAVLGRRARELGGEWLGDKPIKTVKGILYDTAHFEYHPGVDIATYRKSELAKTEFARAQRRARAYA
jgi:hypothetical protein